MSTPHTTIPAGVIRALGVYGYDAVEPVILAALVSGDPLLLVGRHGTGKTYLLNSIAEALGLRNHRHYNASTLAFDDIVGFPMPVDGRITYLPTPATLWESESVLFDELNRCRPEHQNRLFQVVHERRLQGVDLPHLRYRWAAMNPISDAARYPGIEPLDQALADRFAFVVPVADWAELSVEEQRRVADPSGEGRISTDAVGLRDALEAARGRFAALVREPPALVVDFAVQVAEILVGAGMPLSPRRARMLARNLCAGIAAYGEPTEALFTLIGACSLPGRATDSNHRADAARAALRLAWTSTRLAGPERWLHQFHHVRSAAARVRLLGTAPDPDTLDVAISELIARSDTGGRTAFALAALPHLFTPAARVGIAGLDDIAACALPALDIVARLDQNDDPPRGRDSRHVRRISCEHDTYEEIQGYLEKLEGRAARLTAHLLHHLACAPNKLPVAWKLLADDFVAALGTQVVSGPLAPPPASGANLFRPFDNRPVFEHIEAYTTDDGAAPLFEIGWTLEPEGAPAQALARARRLLAKAGHPSFEHLLDALRDELPAGRWLCRPLPEPGTLPKRLAARHARGVRPPSPVHAVLALALCGPGIYAPDRPLVASNSRLARRLQLVRPVEWGKP